MRCGSRQLATTTMTDLITADNEAYGHFWASMTERQRFTGSTGKMAKAGWNSMMFNSAPKSFWTAESGAVPRVTACTS